MKLRAPTARAKITNFKQIIFDKGAICWRRTIAKVVNKKVMEILFFSPWFGAYFCWSCFGQNSSCSFLATLTFLDEVKNINNKTTWRNSLRALIVESSAFRVVSVNPPGLSQKVKEKRKQHSLPRWAEIDWLDGWHLKWLDKSRENGAEMNSDDWSALATSLTFSKTFTIKINLK